MESGENTSSTFLRVDEYGENASDTEQFQEPGAKDSTSQTWIASPEDLSLGADAPTDDPADTGQPAESRSPGRPSLRRDQCAPAPQHDPPPVPSEAVPEDAEVPTDSLSLAQLRRIVQEMPKKEATPYAFEYQDTSSFEEELEELFDYSAEERDCLSNMAIQFDQVWTRYTQDTPQESHAKTSWADVRHADKEEFLKDVKQQIQSNALSNSAIAALCYLALGRWKDTVSQAESEQRESPSQPEMPQDIESGPYSRSVKQIADAKANVSLIADHVGLDEIFSATKSTCTSVLVDDRQRGDASAPSRQQMFTLRNCFTLLYLMVDCATRQGTPEPESAHTTKSADSAPAILSYLTRLLADLRWNESSSIPLQKLLPLFWKTLLLSFGGTSDVEGIRDKFNSEVKSEGDACSSTITTSPLDYHLFRQEITSKYPAFDPPKPLFPFDADTTSMVPPLQDHSRLDDASDAAGPASVNGSGPSIFHQPVHIATPAPSPPPSPAGPGGKGIKKQNYQTNQLFPFLYPPLDDSSNAIGGKGGTELQDLLVGRKWEGQDIPASILEAADIFASRMRATRAMKQLWDERVRFLKYDRGHLVSRRRRSSTDKDLNGNTTAEEKDKPEDSVQELSANDEERLAAVSDYYAASLQLMPSVVIVLLKVLLQTVTTLVTQPNAPNGLQTGFESPEQNPQDKPQVNGHSGDGQAPENEADIENVNNMRTQEIMGKAISSILLSLLKWFKLSHVLKYEYLSQLLLDSNYIQLILKLFTHQELEGAINVKCEIWNLNFFNWCYSQANPDLPQSFFNSPSSTSAAPPPPIPRSDTVLQDDVPPTAIEPDIDPLSQPRPQTITHYSWRNLYSTITHLRVLQKLVKRHPHRQLLMVQNKSSAPLKRNLKLPIPILQRYTLKIIKGQVPYCHRKWRQSNMRVITAIYLHCKPELRDDWLAGLAVEEEVGEALPVEQALRSLTQWYHLVEFGEVWAGSEERAKECLSDRDFFVRELEGINQAEEGGEILEGEGWPQDLVDERGVRW